MENIMCLICIILWLMVGAIGGYLLAVDWAYKFGRTDIKLSNLILWLLGSLLGVILLAVGIICLSITLHQRRQVKHKILFTIKRR